MMSRPASYGLISSKVFSPKRCANPGHNALCVTATQGSLANHQEVKLRAGTDPHGPFPEICR